MCSIKMYELVGCLLNRIFLHSECKSSHFQNFSSRDHILLLFCLTLFLWFDNIQQQSSIMNWKREHVAFYRGFRDLFWTIFVNKFSPRFSYEKEKNQELELSQIESDRSVYGNSLIKFSTFPFKQGPSQTRKNFPEFRSQPRSKREKHRDYKLQ